MRPEVPESGTVNSLGVLEPNPDFLAALQADQLCLPLGWGLRIWFSASSPGDAIGWSLSGFSPPMKRGPRRCTVRGLVTRASLVDLQTSNARRWLHRATLRRDLVRTKGRAGCERKMDGNVSRHKGPAEKPLPWTQETVLSLPPDPAEPHSASGRGAQACSCLRAEGAPLLSEPPAWGGTATCTRAGCTSSAPAATACNGATEATLREHKLRPQRTHPLTPTPREFSSLQSTPPPTLGWVNALAMILA